jgi:hypothetical protein
MFTSYHDAIVQYREAQMPNSKFQMPKVGRSSFFTLDLPSDEAALALARAIAQSIRSEVIVSDRDRVELWTVRPKLDS